MTETYCTDKTENITTFSEVIDADCFFPLCSTAVCSCNKRRLLYPKTESQQTKEISCFVVGMQQTAVEHKWKKNSLHQ